MFNIIRRGFPVVHRKIMHFRPQLLPTFPRLNFSQATIERDLITLSIDELNVWLEQSGIDQDTRDILKNAKMDGTMFVRVTPEWLKSELNVTPLSALRIDAVRDVRLKEQEKRARLEMMEEEKRARKREKMLNKKSINVDSGDGVYSNLNLYSDGGFKEYLKSIGAWALIKVNSNQSVLEFDELKSYACYGIKSKPPTELDKATKGINRLEGFKNNLSVGLENLVFNFTIFSFFLI